MIIFNFDETKDKFNSWWKKEKENNPTEAMVGSSVVGGVTTVSGAAAIGNGIHRLIGGEDTYAGVGPILTITGGLIFTVVGIKSLAESITLYRKIQSKKNLEKEAKKEE